MIKNRMYRLDHMAAIAMQLTDLSITAAPDRTIVLLSLEPLQWPPFFSNMNI